LNILRSCHVLSWLRNQKPLKQHVMAPRLSRPPVLKSTPRLGPNHDGNGNGWKMMDFFMSFFQAIPMGLFGFNFLFYVPQCHNKDSKPYWN
jgi:hypothetical protein